MPSKRRSGNRRSQDRTDSGTPEKPSAHFTTAKIYVGTYIYFLQFTGCKFRTYFIGIVHIDSRISAYVFLLLFENRYPECFILPDYFVFYVSFDIARNRWHEISWKLHCKVWCNLLNPNYIVCIETTHLFLQTNNQVITWKCYAHFSGIQMLLYFLYYVSSNLYLLNWHCT